jgi:transcriptional regulator with PAS, ATPase and Fis domain
LQPDQRAILPLAGSSRTMRELVRQIELLAKGDRAPALLIGEPGTGKGWLAEYIHAESSRAVYPFGTLNCATADAATIGIDLFGSADYPDANPGILEAARGGTICVEEVSELSSDLQAVLLQVLQLSASSPDQPANVPTARVIAATSKDLVNEVNAGRFREDLYYQLSVTPVHVPPLRARSHDDLLVLIATVFDSLALTMSDSPRELGEGVAERLIGYPWPGNLRELRNVLERAMLAARSESVLQCAHLPAELADESKGDDHVPRTIMDVERAHIHRTLRAHKLNRTHAARELGISRATLIKKIKEYGLVYGGPGSA